MAKRNKKLKQHEYEFEAVAHTHKKGFWPMMVIMLGFSFFSASMWAGGTIGSSLRSPYFIFAVIVGNLLLSCYTGLLAYIAGKTNLSTHLLAHYSFGVKGSILPSFLLSITQIGWFGVGVAMFALPVAKVLPEVPLWVLIWSSGLLMTSTAFLGIKALTVLSAIAVPAIILMGGQSVHIALQNFGGWEAWLDIVPKSQMSIYTAIGIVIATFISGGTLTPDFTRFAKSPKISVLSTVLAFFLGNSLMFLFGAVGSAFYQQSDIAEVLFKQGLIWWGVLTLGLNIWTTNDNAIYASGLGLSNILHLPKKYIVIVIGILGTALSMSLYNNFVGWLSILNITLPSIGGVLIADFFVINHGKYGTHHHFKKLRLAGITAWAAGVGGAVMLPGINSLNSVMISVIIYTAWVKIIDKKG